MCHVEINYNGEKDFKQKIAVFRLYPKNRNFRQKILKNIRIFDFSNFFARKFEISYVDGDIFWMLVPDAIVLKDKG